MYTSTLFSVKNYGQTPTPSPIPYTYFLLYYFFGFFFLQISALNIYFFFWKDYFDLKVYNYVNEIQYLQNTNSIRTYIQTLYEFYWAYTPCMKLTVSPLHRPLTLKYFSHNGKNIFYLSIRLLRRGCIFFFRKIKYITLGACVVILQRLYSFDLKSIILNFKDT